MWRVGQGNTPIVLGNQTSFMVTINRAKYPTLCIILKIKNEATYNIAIFLTEKQLNPLRTLKPHFDRRLQT